MKLRPYQERIIQALRVRYSQGLRRLVLVMATGAGKTAVSREMIRAALERGRRVIFVVDLDEVVDDTARGLTEDGIPCGIIQAGKPYEKGLSCYVCSLQTLTARELRPPADLVILDECHCFAAGLTLKLLSDYPSAWHLGLTATPQRGDGTSLGVFYQAIVQGPQVGWLQHHGQCSACQAEGPAGPCVCGGRRYGYLVPFELHAPPRPLKAGRLAWDPVEAWFTFAMGRRTLYFCANRAHAQELVEKFQARGVPAEAITGTTPRKKRKGVRQRLTDRKTLVVCTHSVGIKGWDCRDLECVGLWRRVEVTGTFLQMGGRGLRPSPGKRHMVFLDGAGSVHWHGLFNEERTFSLDGEPIRLARAPGLALCTCSRCSAIQRPAKVCTRCGAPIVAQTQAPKVSRKNQLRVINKVPAPERQERIFDDLVKRGVQIVVPALQRKQIDRGKSPKIGPWFGLKWALKEAQNKWGFTPSEELIEAMRLKYVEKKTSNENLSAE